MVDAVVLAGKDDVPVLQEHHPARQAKVCVRPFVNLVGEGHKDGQCKQVAVQGVDMVNLRCEKRNADEVRPHKYTYTTYMRFLCCRKCQDSVCTRKTHQGRV